MKFPASTLVLALVCVAASAQTPDIGSGAPNEAIRQSFIQDYFRNGFNLLVTVPPLGNVKALGSLGLVQEFADVKNSANKYALVKPNLNAPALAGGADMFQIYPTLYAYYTTVGVTTAGYPTSDTLNCPALVSLPGNSCQYQLFDKPYALFVYKTAILGVSNVPLADPFYTKWQSIGGIFSAGPATAASVAITSPSGSAATVQTFDQAAIFNITSGLLSGRLVAVGPGVYSTYAANGGYLGFLGLPTSDEQLLASGHKRQTFEGGSIEYDLTGAVPPIVLYPISAITVTPGGPLKLNLGDSVTLTAAASDPNGLPLTGRSVVWTTSNSRVLSVQSNGLTASVKAIGGGTATVSATGEGKTSTPVTFVVVSQCCALGEGSPTPSIQQAFQDAGTRNHLNLTLPTAQPVSRLGSGYIQYVQDASTGVSILLALSDRSSSAYVLRGAILAAYLQLGGPAGALGYPSSDPSASGRQLFENQAALAGNPVQLVSGAFLAKWAALSYDSGPLGAPASGQTSALSFRATAGIEQIFANGLLAAAQTGPAAGQVYFVSGLIGSVYVASGRIAGSLGFPTSDQYVSAGLNHQDFEGGYADYAPGDSAAQIHPAARKPLVTATPSSVLVGTRLRLAVGGFDPGATIRISVAGQSDFTVKTDSGAYVWQVVVPSNTKSGAVAVHAVDTATSATATGSYTVLTAAEMVLQLTRTSGDGQVGAPGSVLGLPVNVLVADSSGSPVVGIPVQFSASPGAQVVTASIVSDDTGHAQATIRLPAGDGLALITASAGKQVVTFNARAVHSALTSFPKLNQSNSPATNVPLGNGPDSITQRGALLTSAAAIIRYYQNRGDLPSPNGLADPVALNKFLQTYCSTSAQGVQLCDGFFVQPGSQEQIVNLWRLAAFVGGNLDVSIEQSDINVVRDLVSQGSPVLLALSIPGGSGAAYVVANGVNADGSLAIMDPNPVSGITNLNGAAITAAVRLIPREPLTHGFVVTGNSTFTLASASGSCGSAWTVKLDDSADQFTAAYCDGTQEIYSVDTQSSSAIRLTLTDLSAGGGSSDLAGSGLASFRISRAGAIWSARPATPAFTAAGVVNAASYIPALAPGEIFTVFGSGLTTAAHDVTVQLGGLPASIVSQSPFQVSAVAPLTLAPGVYSLTIGSALGSLAQPVTLSATAPGIFVVGSGQGAILNQNGVLNAPDNPAKRGDTIVIYCTGLGAVNRMGSFDAAAIPVFVTVSGITLRSAFAGPAPGFPGLYQVNVLIPTTIPPGLGQALTLQQGSFTSNSVEVAIQ
jgi:uncharacterized protein (TIGR03437 family)